MKPESRFGAVIVNYDCAPLALDAALSFIGAGGAEAIIIDNASRDGSADHIASVLDGRATHEPTPPPSPIDGEEPCFASFASTPAIRLVKSKRNGGFAFGCNIGLRALWASPRIDRYLLLNPDALVSRRALAAFAARLADGRAGLCGGTVIGFDAPHLVQAFGGAVLDPVLLTGRNIGEGARLEDAPGRAEVEAKISYPLGAAIALRRDYLARAGYLDERYFLYYEEADWALAGGGVNRPAWAPGAVVYHRYGAASKSRKVEAGDTSDRSPLSDYHMTRSRVLFAAKWRPFLAPLAVAAGGAQAAGRLLRGRRANATAVLRGSMPGSARDFTAGRSAG